MTAVATTALIAHVGCGAGKARSSAIADTTPVPSNADDTSEELVVRRAAQGEFPHTPVPRDDRRIVLHKGCEQSGPVVRRYYRPVVEFARRNLLDPDHDAIHERLVTDDSKPTLGDGVNIVVEPRGNVGELRIITVGPPFYPPGNAWAGRVYCLHVLHSGATTTIAVKEQMRWIK